VKIHDPHGKIKKKRTRKYKTDYDAFVAFLKKKKIPFKTFSPDGICGSIAIHFWDDGRFWDRD